VNGSNTLQHPATPCNTLQHTVTHCNTLQLTATPCNTLQRTVTHCSALQHAATHYFRLRYTARSTEWTDWFWCRGWIINNWPICTKSAFVFWNFNTFFGEATHETSTKNRKSSSVYRTHPTKPCVGSKPRMVGLHCNTLLPPWAACHTIFTNNTHEIQGGENP